nr:nitrilase-related carbon-nitrogen hydrolase [Aliamphritea spongicola]
MTAVSTAGFLLTTPLFNLWPGAVIGYLAWGGLCVYCSRFAAGLGSLSIGGLIGCVVFYGVGDLSLPIYLALIFVLALYFGVIGFCSAWFVKCGSVWGVLNAAMVFAVAEFALGATGFPFSLGAAWVNSPFNGLISPYLGNEWQTALYWLLTLALLLWGWIWKTVLVSGFSVLWLVSGSETEHSQTSVKVALLQTSLTSDVINFPGVPGNLEVWLSQLNSLQQQLTSSDDLDLVVFPESVLPGFSGDFTSLSDAIISRVDAPYVLSHQYLLNEQGNVISSNVFRDRVVDTFISNDKEYPVPAFESYLQAGTYQSAVSIKGVSAATFVCSESFFVNLLRERARTVDMLIVTVNDRLLTGSLLPEYHLRMEQLRAAELGLPLLRVANSGPTAIINHRGEVQQKLPEQEAGIVRGDIVTSQRSFFADYYRQVFVISLLVVLFSVGCFLYRFRQYPVGEATERSGSVVVNVVVIAGLSGLVSFSLISQLGEQPDDMVRAQHGKGVSAYDFIVRQTGVAAAADQNIIRSRFAAFDGDLSDAEQLLKKWTFAAVDTIYGQYLLLDYENGVFLVYKDGRVVKLQAEKLTDIATGKPAWFRLRF